MIQRTHHELNSSYYLCNALCPHDDILLGYDNMSTILDSLLPLFLPFFLFEFPTAPHKVGRIDIDLFNFGAW
jgi:hypothetical protein